MEQLRRLNRALDRLREGPALPIASLAAHVGLSESYLGDLFKRHLGESPTKFRQRQRLRSLARELRDRRVSVTDLWAESDFGSLPELTRAIRNTYGVSPREIQKGALPCINPSRSARLARRHRFSLGLRPAGSREPEIVALGRLRLAYRRTYRPLSGGDPLGDLLATFEWAVSRGLPLFRSWGPVGLCYDDFDFDPFVHSTYESAILLPDWFREPLPPAMELVELPSRVYASLRFAGDLAGEEDALDYFYAGWLPRSGYRLAPGPSLEVFLTDTGLADWSRLTLDLLFPIQ